jgi:cellobiose phosphorylase
MYRLITESLLGLRLEVDRLRLNPLLPAKWDSFIIHYRYRETFHHIHVRREGAGQAIAQVLVDDVEQADHSIPLVDDRRDHQVQVVIGSTGAKV